MSSAADRIGIEFLSVFGLPPVDFVHLAADLGCGHVGLGLAPLSVNPHGYSTWSLLNDEGLRQNVKAALRERGVVVALGEGIMVRPGVDIADSSRAIAALRDLGAQRINVVALEPDRSRCFDQLAQFARMVTGEGAMPVVEFGPIFSIPDLRTALEAIEHSGSAEFRLLIDMLHFVRSGALAADLARVDPGAIGYVQLCDGAASASREEYLHEAKYERLPPGEGEFPLPEIVAALPDEILYGLETPMHAQALAGVGPAERMKICIDAARRLLA